jgi:glycosyltransferase involved in cell wall biosynthesis
MNNKKINLSVTLATYNEAANIGRCLEAVKDLADEIIIVDGSSTDDTVKIAKKYGAKVTITDNPEIFHINKNKANDLARGHWILQLDADEVVTPELGEEVKQKIQNTEYRIQNKKQSRLFARHQHALEQRDGPIGSQNLDDPVTAYFIPRRNYFLGKFLKYGGTYPDGVIRLFKKGHAHLPAKSVHEQYVIKGQVGWLDNHLEHYDSPTFERYLQRNNHYSSLFATELTQCLSPPAKWELKVVYSGVKYLFWVPLRTFLNLYLRHKGFLDGFPGLIWAWKSGQTWADAWIKYWEK